MKHILFCNIYDELNRNNLLFRSNDTAIGDDLLRPMRLLKEAAESRGISVATVDNADFGVADAVVFMDMPDKNNKYFVAAMRSGKPLYLMVLESKLVRQSNYDKANEAIFKKIFTYDDSLVDNRKYFKINYSFVFPESINKDLAYKNKLCVMIAGNKSISDPLELYSKRIDAIRWFEDNHPEAFDLYGVGWDTFTLPFLNRFRFLKPLAAKRFPSYRGKVERKKPVLEKYRFAICYENVRDVPGYITEKIFDCFFSGCVPVYWGANNVQDHIPAECFIDKRAYNSYAELYSHMKSMEDGEYLQYLHNIENFLHSDMASEFSCDEFAKTILDQVTLDLPTVTD